MGIHQVNLKNIDSASKFYPSVDCGPVDSGKAKQLLGWTPTKLVRIKIFGIFVQLYILLG